MQPELISVGERAVGALDSWHIAFADIQGAGVPIEQTSAHTPGTTIEDIGKEEIVGSDFMEIQDNPGSRKAPDAATSQNSVSKRFFELVIEAIKAR